MGRVALLVVCTLLVLSGCAVPLAEEGNEVGGEFDDSDGIGVVAGYTATDELDVDSTSLSEADLEPVTYRAMARVEEIRGLEFREDVDIEVVTREEFRERWNRSDEPAGAFRNEVWRAAFVVDGETDFDEALDEVYGGAVQGYYHDGGVVLVADDPDDVRLDRSTFVHELTHALQDQHFGIDYADETIDGHRAAQGLVEGEANYVPTLYDERCGTEWQCLPDSGPDPGSPRDEPINVGLFLSIYAPYAEGPAFVAHLHETGGWDAVDAAHDDRPVSTAQVLHPERYPDDRPRTPSVADRSTGAWEPIADDDGAPRTETIGEATLFASLFANGAIDRPITDGGSDLSPYNYTHPATDGWTGDELVVYEGGGEGRYGHVWTLAWETAADAERFHEAYLELLAANGAQPVEGTGDAHTYRIPGDEPFTGAYHVALDGDEVRIVGGPDLDGLAELRGNRASTAAASVQPAATAP